MKQTKLPLNGSPPVILGYVRVSTDRQELSVDAQTAAIERAIAFHFHAAPAAHGSGALPPEFQIFQEPETSRDTIFAERGQGKRLIEIARAQIEAGRPVTVIVTKVDRLGGSVVDVDQTVTLLQSLGRPNFGGARIIFLDLNVDTGTAMGRAFMQISAVFAQLELARIRERIQTVVDQKRANSELAGSLPFGWNARYHFADGHKELITTYAPGEAELQPLIDRHGPLLRQTIEDNPGEQKWILYMLRCRHELNWSYPQIANDLNARGISTKQGKRLMKLREGARGASLKMTSGQWQCGQIAKILAPSNRTVQEWLDKQETKLAA